MSELLVYVELGVRHILDLRALDHVLFLLALAAIYRMRDWRESLWVVSSFTIGHSLTLALAVTGVLALPTALIEFLIPVTIVATCLENVLVTDRARTPWRVGHRPVLAGIFGLVHGAGFANYLKALFIESVAVPLLGFNIGIELGQVLVLTLAAAVLTVLDRVILAMRAPRAAPSPLRIRVMMISCVVALVATRWAFERRLW
ncbi:MAG: HupE/UreJ family protein [Anaerolineae bacterium]|nr:HupE/UreJ family protein [Gemmatimonadaceae bacterium]